MLFKKLWKQITLKGNTEKNVYYFKNMYKIELSPKETTMRDEGFSLPAHNVLIMTY